MHSSPDCYVDMPDEIENQLLAQIKPVFPQFSEKLIRNVTANVRNNNNANRPVPELLSACIDFLLDMPQENNLQLEHEEDRMGRNASIGHGINYRENGVNGGEPSEINVGHPQAYQQYRHRENEIELNSDDSLDEYVKSFESSFGSNSSSNDSSPSISPSFTNKFSTEKQRKKSQKTDNKSQNPTSFSSSASTQNDVGAPLVVPVYNSMTPAQLLDHDVGAPLVVPVYNSMTPAQLLDPFVEAAKVVTSIIPDVEQAYLLGVLKERFSGISVDIEQMANSILEVLIENPSSYPKNKKLDLTSPISDEVKSKKKKQEIDYFATRDVVYDKSYYEDSILLLQHIFKEVPMKNVRSAHFREKSFARTWKYLADLIYFNKNKEVALPFKLLQKPRPSRPLLGKLHKDVEREKDFIKSYLQKQSELADHATALKLNAKQYEEEGQLIECGCCFGEVVFEQVTQCIEGHLFCKECLQSYAREAIYGAGKMQLTCMTDGCTSMFPESQLRLALSDDMMEKYQERLQDESIKMAELPDLVKCPYCDFAAEVPAEDKVFKCQNLKCMKETCRYCKQPWDEHFGIPCSEVEKKEEKNLRTTYEERMSMAKIRTCKKCECGFMKTDGCNKMTCRCGTTMCYICRTSNISYKHFCNHPRDPGKGCDLCKKCSLWTDPTEDDERAVRELKEEALREAEKITDKGPQASCSAQSGTKRPISIGPPEEGQNRQNKRHKKHHHYHPHAHQNPYDHGY